MNPHAATPADTGALDSLLWVVLPYLALVAFVAGHAWRYRYDKFGWTTRSSQLYENRLLRIGSPLFHFGILFVVLGHIGGPARRHRMERVRTEAKAGDGHLAQVREYLHPQVEEITDTPPTRGAASRGESQWLAAICAARWPAPYPLSMLTTDTPGAHALSMASSAASPSNEAP